MKNTSFKYLAISLLVLFLACQKEIDAPDSLLNNTPKFKEITFEAFSGEEDTKTILDEDGSLSWLPGDEINIFNGNDISGRFISDNTEITDRTTFTGHFNQDAPVGADYWAVYPYMSTNSFDGTGITLSVPATQVSSPGTFGPGMFPSVAKSNSTRLAFYNVCGLIKFSLSRGDINQITLISNGGEAIAGTVNVSFGSDGKPVASTIEGDSEITLRASDSDCFEQGKYYFFSVLPGTLSRGFTMSFRTKDGDEGILESNKSTTIKRSRSSKKDYIDSYVSEWKEANQNSDISETGVYLGILAFNQALYSCPISLLTPETLSTCESFIDGLEMKNGTILYYAADQGLTNMQKGESPKSLSRASLITFTDGLDQGSLMMNPDYSTEDKYLSAVSSRIRNGNVFGMPLSAFSIGIRGSDVQNTEKFRNNLVKLASSESNAYEIYDMSELDSRFEDISNSVSVSIEYSHDISLNIPGLPDGTRVRFTFDDVYDASISNIYIEGTFNLRSRTLSNIKYSGLTSKSGSSIAGVVNDIFVKFNFLKVRRNDGKELSRDSIKQWQSVSGSSNWQINSEFDSASDTDVSVSVSRKSAIIYLVLDCSSSLGSQFSTMKQDAKNFIRKLYNDSYIETNVKSVRMSAYELSIEKGKTAKLSATVYPATALNRSITWSSSNSSIATVNSDGIVTGVSTGSTYIYARTNDGGYSSSCYVTVYELPETITGGESFSKSGLYLGIIAFNQGVYRYPICRLTQDNVESFCSFIDNNPLRNGSLVYYSVDEAISDIAAPTYPSDLSNAALVTFTDCLDQGSLMNRSYTSNDQYLSAVKQRIGSTSINSLPLTAYSIGIRGNDVSDVSGYKANLENLASSESNAYEITNINNLQSKLNDIADVVSIENEYSYSCNLAVTIPGPGNGTIVRFTFDNVSDASQSNLYIEGTFNLSNRSLSNITYKGFSGHPGSTISGAVEGIFVTYTFNNLQKTDNTELGTQYMKEWTSDSGQSNWQVNSEFDNSSDATTEVTQTVSKKSGVIYLVLDYSTSIGYQSSTMKKAAKSFVRALQQKSFDPFAVTSVSLNKTSLTLNEGESMQLVATVKPGNATDKSVVWSSSDESIAKVDMNGIVTAVSKGTVSIKATANDDSEKSAVCQVTVNRLVSSIELDDTTFPLFIGKSLTIKATVLPETANNKSVSWTSSNTSVVTVSSSGVVYGKALGKATVTVMAKDGSGVSSSCDVEVIQPITKITLNRNQCYIRVGGFYSLTATVLPDNATYNTILWTSSNKSVASVDEYGNVTAHSQGNATIKAIANDGSSTSASCYVTVYKASIPNAVDLGLSAKWASFNLGANRPEGYGFFFLWGETDPYGSMETYKWSMGSNNTITKYCNDANYGYNGFVDNKTFLDSEDDAAHVNLGGNWRIPTKAEFEELQEKCTWVWNTIDGKNGYSITGPNGKSIFLPAAGYSSDYVGSRLLYWSSNLDTSYPICAYFFPVDFGGNSGYTNRYCGLSIRPVIGKSEVTLNTNTLSLYVGDNACLTAAVQGLNKDVIWSSDAPDIASVDEHGVVSAKSPGLAIITVKAVDGGNMAHCTVTVNPLPPLTEIGESFVAVDLGLSIKWASFNLGATKPEEYGSYYSWGHTWAGQKFNWRSYKWNYRNADALTHMTKYNASDGLVILELEDDAAHVLLGGFWRIPTNAEQEELINMCSWEWITMNDFSGYYITGPNGNSIFLPAAGIRYTSHYSGMDMTGTHGDGYYGYYWSSSLSPDDNTCSLFLDFGSNSSAKTKTKSRYYGLPIRPVTE